MTLSNIWAIFVVRLPNWFWYVISMWIHIWLCDVCKSSMDPSYSVSYWNLWWKQIYFILSVSLLNSPSTTWVLCHMGRHQHWKKWDSKLFQCTMFQFTLYNDIYFVRFCSYRHVCHVLHWKFSVDICAGKSLSIFVTPSIRSTGQGCRIL